MKSIVKCMLLLIFSFFCSLQSKAEVVISSSFEVDFSDFDLQEYDSSDLLKFDSLQQPINIERTEFSQKPRRCTNRSTLKTGHFNHTGIVLFGYNPCVISKWERFDDTLLNSLNKSDFYKYILFRMLLI